jgi:hypothetical protein
VRLIQYDTVPYATIYEEGLIAHEDIIIGNVHSRQVGDIIVRRNPGATLHNKAGRPDLLDTLDPLINEGLGAEDEGIRLRILLYDTEGLVCLTDPHAITLETSQDSRPRDPL